MRFQERQHACPGMPRIVGSKGILSRVVQERVPRFGLNGHLGGLGRRIQTLLKLFDISHRDELIAPAEDTE